MINVFEINQRGCWSYSWKHPKLQVSNIELTSSRLSFVQAEAVPLRDHFLTFFSDRNFLFLSYDFLRLSTHSKWCNNWLRMAAPFANEQRKHVAQLRGQTGRSAAQSGPISLRDHPRDPHLPGGHSTCISLHLKPLNKYFHLQLSQWPRGMGIYVQVSKYPHLRAIPGFYRGFLSLHKKQKQKNFKQ